MTFLTLNQNFNWSRQQVKNFPVDTIVKIARFRQRYNVYKEMIYPLSDFNEISPQS